MTHWKKLRDNPHLGWWDLEERGEVTVTMQEVVQGELNVAGSSKKERKPILRFVGTEKGMVLNATNAKTIEGLYGPHVEQWAGKRITLYVGKTNFGTERNIPCIRVKNTKPPETTNASK